MRSREERGTRTGRRGRREIAEQWRNATDVASDRCRRSRTGRVMGEISRAIGETIREGGRESDAVCDGRSRGATGKYRGMGNTCAEVEDGRDVGRLVRGGRKVEGQ